MRMGDLMKFVQEQCEVEMSTLDVDISDEVFLHIAKMAHENDITFNQQVTIILENQLETMKQDDSHPCVGCEYGDNGGESCHECAEIDYEECPHDNTVPTAMWGHVCRDCGQNHVITKEECE